METCSDIAEPEPIKYTDRCRVCGREFTGMAVPDFDDPTKPSRIRKLACDPCVNHREQVLEQRRQESAASRSAEARMELAWMDLCPRIYRLTTECDGLTSLDRLRRERSNQLAIASGYQFGPQGILVRGASGAAKSRVIWRALRRLHEQGRRIVAFTPGEFERHCREAGGKFTLREWVDRLCEVECLLLDDLGKTRWSQATVETFFDIVEHRVSEGLPLFITTNYDRTTLPDKLALAKDEAEPLIRRLLEACSAYLFKPDGSVVEAREQNAAAVQGTLC